MVKEFKTKNQQKKKNPKHTQDERSEQHYEKWKWNSNKNQICKYTYQSLAPEVYCWSTWWLWNHFELWLLWYWEHRWRGAPEEHHLPVTHCQAEVVWILLHNSLEN